MVPEEQALLQIPIKPQQNLFMPLVASVSVQTNKVLQMNT